MRNISSLQHPLVKHFVKLKEKSYRHSCQSVLLEGKTLFNELPTNIKVKNIFTTSELNLPNAYLVSQEILNKVSSLHYHDGFIAEIEMPQEQNIKGLFPLLILDNIHDPTNLGALLRSALAFNFKSIFFLGACCDPFNDKAIRSAKGATFKLPFNSGNWESLISFLPKNLYVAQLSGKKPLKQEDDFALLLGSEDKGPSPIPESVSYKNITIQINSQMESLNVAVAGGILMYLLQGEGL